MTVGGLPGGPGGGGEDTRISINAEPKFPENVSVFYDVDSWSTSHVMAYLFLRYECVPSC